MRGATGGLRNGKVEGDAKYFSRIPGRGPMLMVFHDVYHLCDYLEQTEVPGIMMTLLHLTKYLIKKITLRKASLQGWQTDQ